MDEELKRIEEEIRKAKEKRQALEDRKNRRMKQIRAKQERDRAAWLKKLTTYIQQPKLTVRFFDPEMAELTTAEMYVEGFKVTLKKDTSYGGLWTVSFDLKEL